MERVILSILWQASELMTTRDIDLELLVTNPISGFWRLMTKRVGVALHGQAGNGTVKRTQGPGMFVLWAIAR